MIRTILTKKTFCVVLFLCALSVLHGQTLKKCIAQNPDVQQVLGEDFQLKEWVDTFSDQIDQVVKNKDAGMLNDVAEQEQKVLALLELSRQCNISVLKEIERDLSLIADHYRKGLDEDTDTENENDAGFDGLFNDTETTTFNMTVAKARKIRSRLIKIQKKISYD